ncbi:GNAT family N-acetyltransferase [Virgibacillus sp. W0181]|uniref:GNAT family N-acetyltransferase n=1 Tax=Virgibacillus sp. W0181 TaxID=3391581 RepID=UPI003F45A09D
MNIKVVETPGEKEDALYVRTTVFVHEQQVPPELEVDENEQYSVHFVGYENNEPIAAARLRFIGEYGKLERISVLKEHRGKAYGKKMIQKMEEVIADRGYKKSKLNSQTHAENFYKHLGYETVSEAFIDAGIPHITMIKSLDNKAVHN